MEMDMALDKLADEMMFNMDSAKGEGKRQLAIFFLGLAHGIGFNRAWHIAHSRNEKKVIQMSLKGQVIRTWENLGEAQSCTGADKSNISKCCRGFRNSTGGFKWKYIDI